mmetsp:Transcript_584/g.1736  ORF Transcript_584/g.1736 Transcript_584/m.1736 type:complete len:241 (+) Transcript_584:67-789(+)
MLAALTLGALALHAGPAMLRPTATATPARTSPLLLSVASDLLRECSKDERSLERISTLVNELSAAASVSKAKQAVLGDWRLVFAGDADALAPFTSGEVKPPFGVVEDVFCRFEKGNSMKAIEVERRIGPFGNARRSLVGRYSVDTGKNRADRLRFKYLWMDDYNGRERDPPVSAAVEAEVVASQAEGSVLVLRLGQPQEKGTTPADMTAGSILVWSKLRAKELDRLLDELGVKKEDEVGV